MNELIISIFTRENVTEAGGKLYKELNDDFERRRKQLKDEIAWLEMLQQSLSMPDGTTRRKLAEQTVEQMRKEYPAEAKEADKRLKEKEEREQRHILEIVKH